MPNKSAAQKSIRSGEKKHQRNLALKSELKTRQKKIAAELQGNNPEEAERLGRELMSRYDKAANKGIVHRNTAARKKSRMAKKIRRAVSADTK